jgi:endonuclease YncB( thermonuclease family)/methylphosphotriester-DNA--protein-cysteine methyltransferase
MRRSSAILTVIIFCALVVLAQNNIQVVIEGKVVRVADGDTITVLDNQNKQHRIRFQGIDAPESKQAFGQRSKQNLSDLVFGKQVTVIYSKMDKYRRVVGKVMLGGKDVNIEQIKAGLAWHYKKYEEEQPPEDRVSYAKAEQEARVAKRGLWEEPNPTPPGEYRQKVKLDRWGPPPPEGTVIGNKNSKKYHRPDCPGYRDMAERNRDFFKTVAEAEAAGYKRAGNCPPEDMMSKTVAQSAPVAAKSTTAPTTESDEDEDEEEDSSSATVKADPVTPQSDNRPMPVDKSHPASAKEGASQEPVIGNKNSKKYHLTNCPGYKQVSEKNRVTFKSGEEAEAAGYTRASNCSPGNTDSKSTAKSTPAPVTKSVGNSNDETTPTSTVTPKASADPTLPVSASSNVAEPIIGNRNSKIYHKPGCPGYKSVSEKNQVKFSSAAEADAAGFTMAKNCKK